MNNIEFDLLTEELKVKQRKYSGDWYYWKSSEVPSLFLNNNAINHMRWYLMNEKLILR